MKKNKKGLIFTTDETMQTKSFSEPLYETLKPVLGGFMEIVRPRGLPRPFVMLVNDVGRFMDLPLNPIGSYWYQSVRNGEPIVGNIVVMKEGIQNGEPQLLGLTDKDITQLL